MTQLTAANGANLETITKVMNQFEQYAGITEPKGIPTLNTSLQNDVEDFSKKLRSAMLEHLKGEPDALGTFKEALQDRATLITSPEVKNLGEGALAVYLKNIVHIADDGNIEESLNLTTQLHANAGDVHYKGISLEDAPTKTEQAESQWLLQT